MKSTFAAVLYNLQFSEDLGAGDKIKDTMRVTNNRSVISSFLPKEVIRQIGEMEAESLLSGRTVIYTQQEIPDHMTPEQFLLSKLYEVQAFLLTTWLFRDNSINSEMGFLFYINNKSASVSSNFLAHQYSDSRGQRLETKITRDEFREIRMFHSAAIGEPDHPFLRPTSQLTSSHPRLDRTLYIINAARRESDLAMRIASYCTAFETLFSTSHAELTHQLAERIACFLHDEPRERLNIYRKVKNAYAIRSKIVHGSTVKQNKLDEVIEVSEFCDGTLREILHRILGDSKVRSMFYVSADKFDEYMLETIFSSAH